MGLRFEVRFSDKGWKRLQKLSKVDVKRVIEKVVVLRDYPKIVGNTKKLVGIKHRLYRLRVGDIRVIFEVDDKARVIWIIGVDYRGRAYKGW
jgi:mRNA interferase RelE/StbE